MEDEFELVSKSELKKLRENISKKKSETENKSDTKTQLKQELPNNILEEFRKIIQEENKIEKEQIINDLTNIKDLNKSTLSSVLERTDKLDTRIETLVQAISDLVKTVHELVEENTKENSVDNSKIIEEIQNLKSNDNSQIQIQNKLEEIDEFMNNLKLLLSQIKPTDMTLN